MLRTRNCALVTVLAGFLPAAIAAAGDLRDAADPGLQARLEQVVAGQGLARPVSNRHLALALVDLSSPARPRLAMLNGDSMLYAASLPKIAILLGAFVEAEQGRLPLDEPHVQAITQMVRYSSNVAASQVLEWVGERRLIDILESPRFAFYDPRGRGGLWVGKSYGPSPAFLRDPVAGLSPALTQQMKEVLSRPGLHHKFVKGLEGRPGLTIYRKSGTWRDFHSDSALVEAGPHKYVLVGIAQDPHGGQWLERLAAPLHDVIVGPTVARR